LSMQSSTPYGQFAHPNHSVHALKPLIKILSFGALARKPVEPSRRSRIRNGQQTLNIGVWA
jgi:hypothetical protein